MTSMIQKLVKDVYMSKDDPLSTNPNEVLQAIYDRGLMKNVMEKLDSMKVPEKPPSNESFQVLNNSDDSISILNNIPDLSREHDQKFKTKPTTTASIG